MGMKKIYLEPKSEYITLNATWAICGASGDKGGGSDPGFMPKKHTPSF